MPGSIAFTVQLKESYESAVKKVTDALKTEGFGILTTIDVKAAMKEKLGEEFRPYVILGACNPALAHKALSHMPEIGLMLPCNVTVEETATGEVTVRIIDPVAMMSMGGWGEDEVLREVAAEAGRKLSHVAELIG
jgi:uncharacterized protein (DUF302 family)